MKPNQEKITTLLWKSFDEELPEEDRLLLEQALDSSAALRREKASMEKMRQFIASADASFSDDFADGVMHRLQSGNQHNQTLLRVLRNVALTGAAAVIALLVAIYFIDGSLAADALMGISDYSPAAAEFSFFELQDIE